MTQEHAHHPSGPLVLAIVLAATAGFVDAHVYVHVTPVFVANMSGNLIHLGIATGLGNWQKILGSAVALGAFLSGVVAAVTSHDRRLSRKGHLSAELLIGIEALLLLTLPLLWMASGSRFLTSPRLADYPLLIVAAFAMGLQAAALRRVGEIAVSTTYGTGAIVRIGEKVALAGRRANRSIPHRRSGTIAVLTIVLMSYVAGAAIASVIGGGALQLAVPGIVLAITAVLLRRQRKQRDADIAGGSSDEPGSSLTDLFQTDF